MDAIERADLSALVLAAATFLLVMTVAFMCLQLFDMRRPARARAASAGAGADSFCVGRRWAFPAGETSGAMPVFDEHVHALSAGETSGAMPAFG